MVGQVHACHLRTIPILQELTRRGWSTVQSLARSEQISASRGVALKCNGYSSRQAGGSHISSPRPPRATRSSEQRASERFRFSASERERERGKQRRREKRATTIGTYSFSPPPPSPSLPFSLYFFLFYWVSSPVPFYLFFVSLR